MDPGTAAMLRGLALTKPTLKGVEIPQLSNLAVDIVVEVRVKDMMGIMAKDRLVVQMKNTPTKFCETLRYNGAQDARHIQILKKPDMVMLTASGKMIKIGRGTSGKNNTAIDPDDDDGLDAEEAFDRLGIARPNVTYDDGYPFPDGHVSVNAAKGGENGQGED